VAKTMNKTLHYFRAVLAEWTERDERWFEAHLRKALNRRLKNPAINFVHYSQVFLFFSSKIKYFYRLRSKED
jgi:hypothetical protein